MAATARDIEARGKRTLTFQADVSDFARAHAIVEQINAKWGHLNVLLNNAGAPHPKPILEITEAEFDRTIAINLKSCFNFIHAAAPIMLKQDTGGRIISISSINALSGGVTSAVSKHAYAAAKAEILGLTRSLAKELRSSRIPLGVHGRKPTWPSCRRRRLHRCSFRSRTRSTTPRRS